jgi:Ger(x)C family germination protein
LHYSTKQFDTVVTALTSGGKLQTLLIGKRVLEHPNWFKLLDMLYRDPKLSVNCVVAGVDGPLSDVFFYNPKDKPRLMLHIKKLIDTANRRNITVFTTLLELHRQMYEKGETPSITLLKKSKEIEVIGTALLDKKGEYKTLISFEENTLLFILKNKKNHLSLTVKIPKSENNGFFETNFTSFLINNPQVKIKPTYTHEHFNFDIQLKMSLMISERLFSFDTGKKENQFDALIEEQLIESFTALIKKIQDNKVDPIGLGLYARAFQYKAWKKEQEHWGETLSQAKVTVKVKAKLGDSGNIR